MDSIKVLIVDDSSLSRELMAAMIKDDPSIQIVGMGKNGRDGVEMTKAYKPHIVLMDILMPVMDGLDAIEAIMAETPTPILVVTTAPIRDGVDMTFKAIERGALDLMEKPVYAYGPNFAKKAAELLEKIHLLSKIKVIRHLRGHTLHRASRPVVDAAGGERPSIVAIAASTGGPKALHTICGKLPADFPVGIVVVQHMTLGFLQGFAAWLNEECFLEVREAREGDRAAAGTVLIAPSDHHMVVEWTGMVRLVNDPPFQGHRPSGNVLLESVAKNFGARSVGIILTGMGTDGALGIKAIKESGGRTVAQDQATSVVFGMPKSAIDLGVVDMVLPVDVISDALQKIIS